MQYQAYHLKISGDEPFLLSGDKISRLAGLHRGLASRILGLARGAWLVDFFVSPGSLVSKYLYLARGLD